MEQKSTSTLMNVLQSANMVDIKSYHATYLSSVCDSFPVYMDGLIRAKNLKRQDIFQRADLPQKYGYKLISGECHTSDRDKLLRIFIAMKMTLKETQRALALYGLASLYPKLRRDAIIIIAINNEITSVDAVNECLVEHEESPLSESRA